MRESFHVVKFRAVNVSFLLFSAVTSTLLCGACVPLSAAVVVAIAAFADVADDAIISAAHTHTYVARMISE